MKIQYTRGQHRDALLLLRRSLTAAVLGTAFVLLMSACEEQPFGIFASIEREQDVPDSELGEDASIFGMAQMSDDDGADWYWVSMMTLHRRPVNAGPSAWSKAPHPPGFSSDGDHAVSLVGVDNTVYAAFRNSKASAWSVFRRDGNDNTWDSLGTQDHEIHRLFLVNDGTNNRLFGSAITERNSDGQARRHSLVEIATDPSSPNVTELAASLTYPVRGGVHFAGEFYFFTQNTLLVGADPSASLNESSPPRTDPQAVYVFDDGTGNALYISGRGGVSRSTDGEDFTTISGGNTLNGFGVYNRDGTNYLIVGSQDHSRTTRPGDGYYLVGDDDQGSRSSLARISGRTGSALGAQSFEGTLLSTAHIRDFFVANDEVFALTVGRGLWRATIEAGGELSWRWE